MRGSRLPPRKGGFFFVRGNSCGTVSHRKRRERKGKREKESYIHAELTHLTQAHLLPTLEKNSLKATVTKIQVFIAENKFFRFQNTSRPRACLPGIYTFLSKLFPFLPPLRVPPLAPNMPVVVVPQGEAPPDPPACYTDSHVNGMHTSQVPSLELDRVIGLLPSGPESVAYGPRCLVAYTASRFVVLYDPTRDVQHRFLSSLERSHAIGCVAFSRDGCVLAGGEIGQAPSPAVLVWRVKKGERVASRELRGHKYGVAGVAFSHEGEYCSWTVAGFTCQVVEECVCLGLHMLLPLGRLGMLEG